MKTLAVDPRTDKVILLLAANTPKSLADAASLADQIIADNKDSVYETALRGYMLVNSWRNGIDEVPPAEVFEAARNWASQSIANADANGYTSPYGDWVMGYVLKYERRQPLSALHYQRALNYPPEVFLDNSLRRRKHLIGEWTESQLYWLKRDELDGLIDTLDDDPPDTDEAWINWVKCFAYHMMGDFEASNALYPKDLPSDADVSLILAANHARLGNGSERISHRDRFRGKAGNSTWSAAIEMERSPFIDGEAEEFWEASVTQALA